MEPIKDFIKGFIYGLKAKLGSIDFRVVRKYLIIIILIAIAIAVLYMLQTVAIIIKERKEFTDLSLPDIDERDSDELKSNKFEGVKPEVILLDEDGIIEVDEAKIDILELIHPEEAKLPEVEVDKEGKTFEVVEPEVTPIKEGVEIKTTEVHEELYDDLDESLEELLEENKTSDYIDKDEFLKDLDNEDTTEEDEFFDELLGEKEKDDD